MVNFQLILSKKSIKNISENQQKNKSKKPICIIAPSGPCIDKTKYVYAKDQILKLGYDVKEYFKIDNINGFLSDSDANRVKFFIKAIQDSDKFSAIIALRGGYGSIRILHALSDAFKQNKININQPPKCPIIGFSDFTAILSLLSIKFKNNSLNLFHGPHMLSIFEDNEGLQYRVSIFQKILENKSAKIDLLDGFKLKNEIKVLRKGTAKGLATGGNLSVLASLIGTKFQINTKNKILILEDINEPAYKIDRILTQIKLSGTLDGVKGIAIGIMKDCNSSYGVDVESVFLERLKDLKVPILMGLPFGHVEWNGYVGMGKYETKLSG